jgi:hypothetical protein
MPLDVPALREWSARLPGKAGGRWPSRLSVACEFQAEAPAAAGEAGDDAGVWVQEVGSLPERIQETLVVGGEVES